MTTTEQPVFGPEPTLPAQDSHPRIRRPLPALVAALSVVVAYLGLAFIQVTASALYGWASGRFEDSILRIVPSAFQALQQDVPVSIVVLAVAFLSLWGALPIHAGLRLGGVIGRGVLTAVIAGLITGVVVGIQYLTIIRNLSYSAGQAPGAGSILRTVAEAADNSVSYFVQTGPVVLLGALILWNWSRTHPAKAAVVGDTARV